MGWKTSQGGKGGNGRREVAMWGPRHPRQDQALFRNTTRLTRGAPETSSPCDATAPAPRNGLCLRHILSCALFSHCPFQPFRSSRLLHPPSPHQSEPFPPRGTTSGLPLLRGQLPAWPRATEPLLRRLLETRLSPRLHGPDHLMPHYDSSLGGRTGPVGGRPGRPASGRNSELGAGRPWAVATAFRKERTEVTSISRGCCWHSR